MLRNLLNVENAELLFKATKVVAKETTGTLEITVDIDVNEERHIIDLILRNRRKDGKSTMVGRILNNDGNIETTIKKEYRFHPAYLQMLTMSNDLNIDFDREYREFINSMTEVEEAKVDFNDMVTDLQEKRKGDKDA